MQKKCSKCGVVKDVSLFYVKDSVFFSWCRNCCCEHQKKYKKSKARYQKEYSKRKPEVLSLWRMRNKDKIREHDRSRYLRDKIKIKERNRKYRLIRRGVLGHHTIKEWNTIKYAYEYTCWICGRKEPYITLTRDHVVPISRGGTDNIENIMPLCLHCNCSKGNKQDEWYKERLTKSYFKE